MTDHNQSPSPGLLRKLQPLGTNDPTRLGGYLLLGQVGAGGMGNVYVGRSDDNRLVAIKVIRAEFAGDPVFRARFRREAQAASLVEGICTARVHGADLDSARPYLVTDFIEGPTLHDYVERRGPIRDERLLHALAIGLLEAVTAIHDAGVVHRDLKPANVILASDGPKVIDFGIAHASDLTSITVAGTIMGSPAWMAPEQLETNEVTAAADVFAWAGTVYYAATGDAPFGKGRPEVILYRIVHRSPALDALPVALRPHLAAALGKRPETRPTAVKLLSSLAPIVATGVTSRSAAVTTVLSETWRIREQADIRSGRDTKTVDHHRLKDDKRRLFLAIALIVAFFGVAAWSLRPKENRSLEVSPTTVAVMPSTTVAATIEPGTSTATVTTPQTPTTSTTPVDSKTALARLAGQFPDSTQSPIVPRSDGELAAIGYGQGVVIYRYVENAWISRGTVTISNPVDTTKPIDVADVTFDGEPDFLVHLRTGTTLGGSVVSAHSRVWRLVPFLNDSGVAEPWRTGAVIANGRLLSYAVGSRVAEPWLYSTDGGYLYRNLGPGRGGIGE